MFQIGNIKSVSQTIYMVKRSLHRSETLVWPSNKMTRPVDVKNFKRLVWAWFNHVVLHVRYRAIELLF